MTYKTLLKKFLVQYDCFDETIFEQSISNIHKNNFYSENDIDDDFSVIINVLTDTFDLNSQNVKNASNFLTKEGYFIGRLQKELLKEYFDYRDEDALNNFFISIHCNNKNFIMLSLDSYDTNKSNLAVSNFLDYWRTAEINHDNKKKEDYITGIYSKLMNKFSTEKLSLSDIFIYNKPFYEDDLSQVSLRELENYCSSTKLLLAQDARRLFCDKYSVLLKKDLQELSNKKMLNSFMNKTENKIFSNFETESFDHIIFNVDQKLFDKFNKQDLFFDYVLSVITEVYRLLDNNKAISIKIDNIFDGEKNLKWFLYSYIGIYAEHFIPLKENRAFYKPEELCVDTAVFLGLNYGETEKKLFKQYFTDKISYDELSNLLKIDDTLLKNILKDYQNIWYGYNFSDCLILDKKNQHQIKELNFIENTNTITLIFYKYAHDDRKLPCPACAGLNVSGNSFPEVGLRSWECKNIICPERSKSNRGKRYSKKSNYMQQGFLDGVKENIIEKDFIAKWRRDISAISTEEELDEMLIRYFSFTDENILAINDLDSSIELAKKYNRKLTLLKLDNLNFNNYEKGIFNAYFNNGDYIKRFLFDKEIELQQNKKNIMAVLQDKKNNAILINGNSLNVINAFPNDCITAAVTSPPYYNAREYSQWQNLYTYLTDMYNITKAIFKAQKKGGVYLYNIGDICDNENTVVKSTMGNKRILLGAYTIFIFLQAGYDFIEKLIWDKGEPQSNRQKNDGKFTPHYQKPMNVYEHMFLFKKPGDKIIVSDDLKNKIPPFWDKNIIRLTPVIKINSKGENIYGHTAPFPEDIPNFVSKVFTKNNDDLVLEPFLGSATSIIASAKNDIRSVGIELSKEYFELSKNRCEKNNLSFVAI